jgi:hypothetical protein
MGGPSVWNSNLVSTQIVNETSPTSVTSIETTVATAAATIPSKKSPSKKNSSRKSTNASKSKLSRVRYFLHPGEPAVGQIVSDSLTDGQDNNNTLSPKQPQVRLQVYEAIHYYYTTSRVFIYYVSTYLRIYISTYLCIYVSTYLYIYLYMYLLIYVSTYLRIYVSTYLRIYVSTYLRIYLSTHYVSTYSYSLLLVGCLSTTYLYPSKVVHNYVVERGWSGANEHYTQ